MNRRHFLKFLLGGMAFWAGGCFFPAAKDEAKKDLMPMTVGDLKLKNLRQIITDNPAVSRMFMWQSNDKIPSATLEYRPKGADGETKKIAALDESFEDDGEKVFQYSARIEYLTPGGEYEYRIAAGENASAWQEFRAANTTGGFKAIIFPDSQSSDYNVWENVAQNAIKANPDADFFVGMGDLVDNGEDSTQWQAWFAALLGLIDKIPFAPVMGNHETYDRKWQVRLPNAYLKYFAPPANNSEKFPRYYYSFTVGDVHFAVINTQWEETDEFADGLVGEQISWLKNDVKKNGKKWNVALLHKDVLQYRISGRPERKEGFSDVGAIFMPLFEELRFDVVFTAHLHTYRDRGRIKNFARDDTGPLYILTGIAGDVRYPNLWTDHALDEFVAPQPETDNYIVFSADNDKLTVAAYLPDGTEIEKREITKGDKT